MIENPHFISESLKAAEFFIQGRCFLLLPIEFIRNISSNLPQFIFVEHFIRLVWRRVEVKQLVRYAARHNRRHLLWSGWRTRSITQVFCQIPYTYDISLFSNWRFRDSLLIYYSWGPWRLFLVSLLNISDSFKLLSKWFRFDLIEVVIRV